MYSSIQAAVCVYSNIPVLPTLCSLHRQWINTSRHPNSLEVNASLQPDDLNLLPHTLLYYILRRSLSLSLSLAALQNRATPSPLPSSSALGEARRAQLGGWEAAPANFPLLPPRLLSLYYTIFCAVLATQKLNFSLSLSCILIFLLSFFIKNCFLYILSASIHPPCLSSSSTYEANSKTRIRSYYTMMPRPRRSPGL